QEDLVLDVAVEAGAQAAALRPDAGQRQRERSAARKERLGEVLVLVGLLLVDRPGRREVPGDPDGAMHGPGAGQGVRVLGVALPLKANPGGAIVLPLLVEGAGGLLPGLVVGDSEVARIDVLSGNGRDR